VAATFEAGGGSYGDPLKRDPALVRRDVLGGLVSRQVAERVHGVVFRYDGTTVDVAGTGRCRGTIRSRRRARKPARERDMKQWLEECGVDYGNLKLTRAVSDFLEVRASPSDPAIAVIGCVTCGSPLCTAEENLREYLSRSGPIPPDFLSPVNSYRVDPRFSMIEYSCPYCGTLLSVDIVLDTELDTVRPEFYLKVGA
jgi:N-methylhydantoinase B